MIVFLEIFLRAITVKSFYMIVINFYNYFILIIRIKLKGESNMIQEVNIEDVKVGDLVQTKDGWKSVTSVWDPETLEEGTPECYEVTFEDGNTYTMSAKHKLLLDGEWIEAQEMEVGMDFAVLEREE